ncbi:hypothetical protein GWK47_000865 [Chionoecetes opilio]|uniref:Uncharacterized protein n=1 Tax=Chionoecetes opilio TaxID=41210 RepID=A0A8J4Y4W3_CHIOP|nr:hypothetical protein GWK47_000865 [Chionoecetes opilio]
MIDTEVPSEDCLQCQRHRDVRYAQVLFPTNGICSAFNVPRRWFDEADQPKQILPKLESKTMKSCPSLVEFPEPSSQSVHTSMTGQWPMCQARNENHFKTFMICESGFLGPNCASC